MTKKEMGRRAVERYIFRGAPTLPHDERDDELTCGHECHHHPTYGFVPEDGCPVHDVKKGG